MLRILLIEDDLIDQLALSRLIKKNNVNCDLKILDNVLQANDLLKQNKIDLVICDLNLPDGQAFDLGNLIRQQPFVLLSGHIDEKINQRAFKSGATQVIQKGSDLNHLKSILDLIKQMEGNELTSMNESSQIANSYKSNSAFNINLLKSFFNNDQEEIKTILELFVKQNPKTIQDAFDALESNNLLSLKNIIHRIKSNYLMFGLKDQHRIASEIDELILKEDQEMILEKLNSLRDEMERQYLLINIELNKLLENTNPNGS